MKYPKLLGVLLMLAVVLSACSSAATPTNAPIDTISPATLEPSGTGTAGIPSTGGGTGTPTGSSSLGTGTPSSPSGGTTGTGTPSTGSGTAGVPATGASCDTVTVQLNSAAGTGSTGGTGSTTTGTATPSTGTTSTGTPSTGTGTTGTATTAGNTASASNDFLVDCNGMALYINMDDTPNSGATTCNDDCATEWMPLTVDASETPMAGKGVDESLLSTITRDDGKTQVTYNGWPLYLYSGDSMAGDQNGVGEGDVWFLIDADGNPIQQ